jgi:outer membrane lipoprotein-sorting protein
MTANAALSNFYAAWGAVESYTCTITTRETSSSRIQERTYEVFFRKPHDTRMNIVSGDGKGNMAVWRGGERVTGRQQGLLSFIKLDLGMHDGKVVTLRGRTIAEANFGAFFDHIKGLKNITVSASSSSETNQTKISIVIPNPTADNDITSELVVLGPNNMPIEYDQWDHAELVEHIVYSDVHLNVHIPDSVFTL